MNQLTKAAAALTLVSALGLQGCSTPQVVRVPAPLVEMASPLALSLDWQLKQSNLLAADAQGIQLVSDEDVLFFISPDGTLTAARMIANGAWQDQVIWQKRFNEPLLSGVALVDGSLIVGSAKGNLFKLAKTTGEIEWQKSLSSEALSLPVVGAGLVYSRTVDGKVYAISLKTGEQVWVVEHQLPSLSLRGVAPVTLDGDKIYVGWETGQLQALSAQNGEQLWQTQVVVPKGRTDLERLVDLQSKILSVAGRLYVLAYHGKLVALNPGNGNLYWSKSVSGYQNILVHQNMLLVADEDDLLSAFDLANGTKIWQSEHFKYRNLSNLQLDNEGRLVFGDGQGFVHWIDPLDGTLIARADHAQGRANGEAVIRVQPLADRLYLQDSEGYVSQYEVKPSNTAPSLSLNKNFLKEKKGHE